MPTCAHCGREHSRGIGSYCPDCAYGIRRLYRNLSPQPDNGRVDAVSMGTQVYPTLVNRTLEPNANGDVLPPVPEWALNPIIQLPPSAIEAGREHIDRLTEDYNRTRVAGAVRDIQEEEDARILAIMQQEARSVIPASVRERNGIAKDPYMGLRKNQWEFLLEEELLPQKKKPLSLEQQAVHEIQAAEDARIFSEIPDLPRRNQWDHLADGQDQVPLTTQVIDLVERVKALEERLK